MRMPWGVSAFPHAYDKHSESKRFIVAQSVLEDLTDYASIALSRKDSNESDVVGSLSQRSVLVISQQPCDAHLGSRLFYAQLEHNAEIAC